MKCMMTTAKMEAAATHFETMLTLLIDCGSKFGWESHRKQMLPLLVAVVFLKTLQFSR